MLTLCSVSLVANAIEPRFRDEACLVPKAFLRSVADTPIWQITCHQVSPGTRTT